MALSYFYLRNIQGLRVILGAIAALSVMPAASGAIPRAEMDPRSPSESPSLIAAQTLVAQTLAAPPILAQQPDVNQLLEDARQSIDDRQYGQALALYQQAAQMETDNALIYSAIAYAQLQLGNLPAAASAFQQAIALDRNNADFAYGLGRTLGEMGDLPGSEAALRQSLTLNSKNQDVMIALGKVLELRGDLNGSLAIYEQLITLDRRNWQSYLAKADLLMRQGRHGEAIDILEQAKVIVPYEPEVYVKLSTAEFGLGNPRAGFAAFEEAMRLDPHDSDLYLKQGAIYSALGSSELALGAYQQALRLNGNLAEAREAVIRLYLDQESYLFAVVNSQFWVERDPQNPLPYQYLGMALQGRGRTVEAMNAYQQARMLYQQNRDLPGVQRVEQLMRQRS